MAKEITEEVKNEPTKEVGKVKFNKESLLNSAKYSNRKDLLNVLLENNVEYTIEQVDKLIENFMKGEVK